MMEQPWDWAETPATRPAASSRICRVTSSPQKGLNSWVCTSTAGSGSRRRGWRKCSIMAAPYNPSKATSENWDWDITACKSARHSGIGKQPAADRRPTAYHKRDGWGIGMGLCRRQIRHPPPIPTVLPARYRHSRAPLPSFPRKRESRRYCLMMVLSTSNREIPAYAGMTVARAGMTVGGPGRTKSRHPPPKQEMMAKGFRLYPTSGCGGRFSCRWPSRCGFAKPGICNC